MLTQATAYRIPIADKKVHLIMTSPPYWGKRDYGLAPQIYGGQVGCEHKWGEERSIKIGRSDGGRDISGGGGNYQGDGPHKSEISSGQFCQHCTAWRGSLGLEPSIELFIQHLIEVFRECWRVLRDDGVMFVNIGDGHKNKNLHLAPQRLIIALQDYGWIVRNEIIWHKPNPMPESATDRMTVAHEQVFMVTKRARYFWDGMAVREKNTEGTIKRLASGPVQSSGEGHKTTAIGRWGGKEDYSEANGRTGRTVWTIPTENYSGAHFATFPKKLCRIPILGGTSQRGACGACGGQWVRTVEKSGGVDRGRPHSPKSAIAKNHNAGGQGSDSGFLSRPGWREDPPYQTKTTGWQPSCDCNTDIVPAIVLDPFAGSGTVGQVAHEAGRRFIGLDLSIEYLKLAMVRAERKTPQEKIDELPLFAGIK